MMTLVPTGATDFTNSSVAVFDSTPNSMGFLRSRTLRMMSAQALGVQAISDGVLR